MNREIKFKYYFPVGEDGEYETIIRDLNDIEVDGYESSTGWEARCQYTGLKDKNGKEIYEGDIIKHSYRSDLTIIEWQEKKAQWSMGGYQSDTVEVIGNIYENPDLTNLKGETVC